MSAIVGETGALSFDLKPSKQTGDTGVRANRRQTGLAIDNQGIEPKEVVGPEPHS